MRGDEHPSCFSPPGYSRRNDSSPSLAMVQPDGPASTSSTLQGLKPATKRRSDEGKVRRSKKRKVPPQSLAAFAAVFEESLVQFAKSRVVPGTDKNVRTVRVMERPSVICSELWG
jgi:hypothetical protein